MIRSLLNYQTFFCTVSAWRWPFWLRKWACLHQVTATSPMTGYLMTCGPFTGGGIFRKQKRWRKYKSKHRESIFSSKERNEQHSSDIINSHSKPSQAAEPLSLQISGYEMVSILAYQEVPCSFFLADFRALLKHFQVNLGQLGQTDLDTKTDWPLLRL